MKLKDLPPCDNDCLNCKRPERYCHGGKQHCKTPYVRGTRPRDTVGKGDFGAVKIVETGYHVKYPK